MPNAKQAIVDRFFQAFGKHDLDGIRQVMAEDATWYFLGRHPYAGVKKGVEEIVEFFGTMGKIMAHSSPTVEKAITAENDRFLIEAVRTKTDRTDGGPNVEHQACVLWKFKDGKIVEGRHFFADPEAVDRYFTAVAEFDSITV